LPPVIASAPIDPGRGHADFDAVLQNRVERARVAGRNARGGSEQAEIVAREHRHHAGPAVGHQPGGMADAGRGEDVDLVAGLDALVHAAGGAEFGAYGNTALAAEQGSHVGHRLAQAAGAIEHESVVLRPCRHRQGHGEEGQQGALSEVGQHIRSLLGGTRNIWRIAIYTD
jgi:hypothetical protein